MANKSGSSNDDAEGLDAAKDEIDEEPEAGLGPGADGEETDAEEESNDENDSDAGADK